MPKRLDRQRLDQLLVARNLAPSREKAQAMILAGEVLVNGAPIAKSGHSVRQDAADGRLGRAAHRWHRYEEALRRSVPGKRPGLCVRHLCG